MSPEGPVVSAPAAAAMATGVAAKLGADVGLAVTGVAGPDSQEGHPPGTVFMAVALPDRDPITVEAGHSGTVEPDDVAVLVNGTLSVMRHLKMLAGAPTPVEHPVWIDHLADVSSEHAGIFYSLVRPGSYAEAGMALGYVTDFVGRRLGELRAKEAGIVLYVRAVPSVGKGDTIASVGVVGKAP